MQTMSGGNLDYLRNSRDSRLCLLTCRLALHYKSQNCVGARPALLPCYHTNDAIFSIQSQFISQHTAITSHSEDNRAVSAEHATLVTFLFPGPALLNIAHRPLVLSLSPKGSTQGFNEQESKRNQTVGFSKEQTNGTLHTLAHHASEALTFIAALQFLSGPTVVTPELQLRGSIIERSLSTLLSFT